MIGLNISVTFILDVLVNYTYLFLTFLEYVEGMSCAEIQPLLISLVHKTWRSARSSFCKSEEEISIQRDNTFPVSRSCSLKLHACSQGDAITVEEPGPKLFSTSMRLKTASLILVLEAVAFVEHICVPGGNAAEQTGGKYPVKSEWFRAEIPNGEC